MDAGDLLRDVSTQTSTTVASTKITITVPAKTGLRVYILAADWTTDLAGNVELQDATVLKYAIPNTTVGSFRPGVPVPISSAGAAAQVVLPCTTTGRLSVIACYGM